MKKMILISMAVITLLGLMSFTTTDETYADFDNSKAVYSGPCGNYSVDVNTLTNMYYMLPANIRKDFDKAFEQSGHLLFDGTVCSIYDIKLVGKRNHETDNYDFTITYQDHIIKIDNIGSRDVDNLFNFYVVG
jgi:hypothetical protein